MRCAGVGCSGIMLVCRRCVFSAANQGTVFFFSKKERDRGLQQFVCLFVCIRGYCIGSCSLDIRLICIPLIELPQSHP